MGKDIDEPLDGDADLERELEAADADQGPTLEDFEDDESPPRGEPEPEPEPPKVDTQAEHLRRQTEAKATVDAWEIEVAKLNQAYDQAKAEVAKIEKAYDEGNIEPDAKVTAYERMTDARFALKQAEGNHAQAKTHAEQAATQVNEAAQGWIDKNPRFRSDQRFADEAVAMSKRLEAEGLRNDHPRFYQELDRRLKRTPAMGKNGSRTSGAPVSRGDGRSDAQKAAPTEFDTRFMTKFGFDPNNKRHLQEWRKHKRQMNEEHQARGGR